MFAMNDGSKVAVRYSEANVQLPTVSIGDAAQQGNWIVFGPSCQAMLSDDEGNELRKVAHDQRAVILEKRCGAYWLPCAKTGSDDAAFPI